MSLCPCVHPFDFSHGDLSSSSCPNGIIQSTTCAPADIIYPVPSAGSAAFFTSWSWVYIMFCLALGVLYAILNGLGRLKTLPKLGKVTTNVTFQVFMLSLIAMGAINSVGVFSTSQLLLAKNFKLVNTKGGPLPDDLAISTSFFHNAMNINLDAHQIPAIIAILLLVLLGTCKTKQTHHKGKTAMGRSWKANLGLFGGIMLAQILLVFLWMAVPVKDKKTGKTYQWVEKIQYVYADPPGWFFGVQALLVFVLALAMAFKIS